MRALIAVTTSLILTAGLAVAQTTPPDTKSDPARSTTGRSPSDASTNPGQMQPQGPTGPLNTKSSGGAPASSPQGETPPGMQAAPEGSGKTIVDGKKQ
jgi:hypothetical protein